MWLFTRYGFFSISVSGDDVWVRARLTRHLLDLCTRFNLNTRIIENAGTDYACRIRLNRQDWEKIILEITREQDWDNFKNEAMRFNGYNNYVVALHDVWEVMYRLQVMQK